MKVDLKAGHIVEALTEDGWTFGRIKEVVYDDDFLLHLLGHDDERDEWFNVISILEKDIVPLGTGNVEILNYKAKKAIVSDGIFEGDREIIDILINKDIIYNILSNQKEAEEKGSVNKLSNLLKKDIEGKKYLKNLRSTCRDEHFGLELETCYHILREREEKEVDKKSYRKNVLIKQMEIVKCFQNKSKEIDIDLDVFLWNYIYKEDDESIATYDTWSIMPDQSISCKESKNVHIQYCISKNKKQDCDKDMVFWPIEIVTPILSMDTQTYRYGKIVYRKFSCGEGMYILTMVWLGWLLSDNLIYNVNNSQGLHINLSHPEIDIVKFINLWYVFEPVIENFILPERRKDLVRYAIPYRYILPKGRDDGVNNVMIGELTHGKYVAVRVHEIRVEIRIYSGTMDFYEVYNWAMFCILLFGASILLPNVGRNVTYNTNEEKKEGLRLLLSIIQDTSVQQFLVKIYNERKRDNWPNFEFKSDKNVRVFPHPCKDFTEKDWKIVRTKPRLNC